MSYLTLLSISSALTVEVGITAFVFVVIVTYLLYLVYSYKKKTKVFNYSNSRTELISGLVLDYEAVVMVDVNSDTLVPLRISDYFRNKWMGVINSNKYSKCMKNGIQTVVFPDDRDRVLDIFDMKKIMKRLKSSECYKDTFRIVSDNTPVYIEAKFTKCTEKGVTGFILGTRNVDNEIKSNIKSEEDNRRKETLLNVLTGDYLCVLYYNLADNTSSIVKLTDDIDIEDKELFVTSSDRRPFLNKYLLNYVHGEDRSYFDECLNPALIKLKIKEKQKFSLVYRRILPDGGFKYMEMTFAKNPSEDNSDDIIIGFADIDELYRSKLEDRKVRQLEKETITQLQEDKDIEHAFAEIFVDTYVSAYYIDLNGSTYKHYNIGANRINKFIQIDNYHVAAKLFIDSVVAPEDRERIMSLASPEKIRSLLKTHGQYSDVFAGIINGQRHYYKVRIVRGLDENHAGVGLIDVNDEITKQQEEKAHLEENLRIIEKQQKLLEESNIAKTRFLFNMSHDIRTPLNAVNGYTGLILKHPDNVEKVIEYGNKILSSGEHLLNLINELLDMSRIEAGVIKSDLKAVDIIRETQNLVDICRENAVSRDIAIKLSVDVRDKNVYIDELHVNQVMMNVISNAIKYSNNGGRVDINVKQLQTDNTEYAKVRFIISDNGIGMSKEFLEHIFDSFSRENTSTISGIEGTGLGMAIVKKLVDFMDGDISVNSSRDEGTTVTIDFNFRKAEQADRKSSHLIESDNMFEGTRVLVVEDNEMNREIIVEILKEIGCVPFEAVDGQQAVNMVADCEKGNYDLILMDIQMPIMNGYDATLQIRKLDVHNDIPIIALSANAFEDDIKKSLEVGMDAHIPKPIDMPQLLSTMESVLKTPQIGKTG